MRNIWIILNLVPALITIVYGTDGPNYDNEKKVDSGIGVKVAETSLVKNSSIATSKSTCL